MFNKLCLSFTWVLFFISANVYADFPEGPIKIVVPFAPGTASDQLARAMGQSITAQTGQIVTIDNKPGGNGFIGATSVARSEPDGYSLFLGAGTTHSAAEHLFKNLPYDPVKDFSPITGLGKGWQILIVNQNSPIQNIQDLIKFAKENPGKVTFASGNGSSRVAGELFQQMANISLLNVPYKSNTFAVTSIMAGEVDMMIPDTATSLALINSGKIRALGVSTLQRSNLLPNIPTISEAGVPGFEMGYWFGIYAPAKTPQVIINKLNQLFAKAADSESGKQFYASSAINKFITTPQGLAEFQKIESEKWGATIKKAGIEKQ
jgi:tripartite-type tricarboxylate transporter receptor subunit TctC